MNNTLSANRLNDLSSAIIDSCISVHREMGPGLLESVYHHCLMKEFNKRGIAFNTLVPVQLFYKGDPLNKEFVVDLLVEDQIIVELKSVEGILRVHEAQVISYLKLCQLPLGLLINFNVALLKDGIRRFVYKFPKALT